MSLSVRPRTAAIAMALLAATPAVALAAQPKANGAYYTPKSVRGQTASIGILKHRITNANASVRFTKGGKLCTPPEGSSAQPFSISVTPKKAVAASSDGSFSFKGKSTSYGKKTFTATISGKFVTSKKATLKISGAYKGCKGSFSSTNAVYTQGG